MTTDNNELAAGLNNADLKELNELVKSKQEALSADRKELEVADYQAKYAFDLLERDLAKDFVETLNERIPIEEADLKKTQEDLLAALCIDKINEVYTDNFKARGSAKAGTLTWADTAPPSNLKLASVDDLSLSEVINTAFWQMDPNIDGTTENRAAKEFALTLPIGSKAFELTSSVVKEGEETFIHGAVYNGLQGVSINDSAGLVADYTRGAKVDWVKGNKWTYQEAGWAVSDVNVDTFDSTTSASKSYAAAISAGANISRSIKAGGLVLSQNTAGTGMLTNNSAGLGIATNNMAGLRIATNNMAGLGIAMNNMAGAEIFRSTVAGTWIQTYNRSDVGNIETTNRAPLGAINVDNHASAGMSTINHAGPLFSAEIFARDRVATDHTFRSSILYDNDTYSTGQGTYEVFDVSKSAFSTVIESHDVAFRTGDERTENITSSNKKYGTEVSESTMKQEIHSIVDVAGELETKRINLFKMKATRLLLSASSAVVNGQVVVFA